MLKALQIGYKPRETRHPVLIPARMRLGESWVEAVIHNLSSGGALVASDETPERGTYVEIRRGRLTIIGRVVWRKDRFFGIQAQGRLDIAAIINEPRLASRPRSANDPESSYERRAQPRADADARIARQLENSRRWSAAFQFGVFVVLALIAAGFAANELYQILSRPFSELESHL
ncbi:PilZ domain-containing protein [Sphingobium fuliginis]|uniref:PilZ domain-containing protein n=1 Tax=Sphingobium fuliginis (strain ATCC 27551) TaxID=336203 RepID=A0A7M2GG39_SPHSA|nr:PilZ domain-containing protein [Sphingobium fuliginis]QOT71563.1 PilZ domain-containing protein [Sphingobium fuliginis]